MTVELAPPPAPAQEHSKEAAVAAAVEENGNVAVDAGNGNGNGNGNADHLFELHRACAEGNVEEVKAVLTRNFEALEALGCTPIVLAIRHNHPDVVRELLAAGAIVPPMGLTSDPLLLSLLYPQPMYALPPQYMGQSMTMPAEYYAQPGYYQDPRTGMGMYSPPSQTKDAAAANGNGNGANNTLPPAEVSKTIPCRNFPNCKYGPSCVFFHPRMQPNYYGGPGGFPGYDGYAQSLGYQPMPYYAPNGYQPSQHFQQIPQQQQQQSQQASVPSQGQNDNGLDNIDTQQQQIPVPAPQQESHSVIDEIPTIDSAPISNSENSTNTIAPAPLPLAGSQEFDPSFNQAQGIPPIPLEPQYVAYIPAGITSPQQSVFPLSPNMIPQAMSPVDAFYPTSPQMQMMQPVPVNLNVNVNGFIPQGNQNQQSAPPAHAHLRRQSINQNQSFVPGGVFIPNGNKPFHAKRPSFSAGPRPHGWGGPGKVNMSASGNLGSWKDGVPPPCAFFLQGKCRNGEFCKFPHIDAEGNDCRNPDVIRGVIPPAPPLGRHPRAMRMGMSMGNFGPYDPSRQHHFLQRLPQHNFVSENGEHQSVENSASAPVPALANGDNADAIPEASASSPADVTTTAGTAAVPLGQGESQGQTAEETAVKATTPASVAGSTGVTRSTSQPGFQRPAFNGNGNGNGHANGFNSRSQSPAPSNISFHGNGHPRRGGRGYPVNGNGHAHHANGNGNGNGHINGVRSISAGETKSNTNSQRVPGADEFPALGGAGGAASGNTSPQEKSVSQFSKTAAQVLLAPAPAPAPTPAPAAKPEISVNGADSDEDEVTMDSDGESDTIVITVKPQTSASLPETRRPSASFASVASSVAAAAAATLGGGSGNSASASVNGSVESAPVALKA